MTKLKILIITILALTGITSISVFAASFSNATDSILVPVEDSTHEWNISQYVMSLPTPTPTPTPEPTPEPTPTPTPTPEPTPTPIPHYADASNNIIYLPDGCGWSHTYTVWNKINWVHDAGAVISYLGDNVSSDEDGFVTYGHCFAGAMTSTFGNVGDVILIVQDNNTVYPVIMADTKCQNWTYGTPADTYGHRDNTDVVEFEIMSWGATGIYHGSGSNAGERFDHNIVYAINVGSVYDDMTYALNVKQACIDNGLDDMELILPNKNWRENV